MKLTVHTDAKFGSILVEFMLENVDSFTLFETHKMIFLFIIVYYVIVMLLVHYNYGYRENNTLVYCTINCFLL